MLMISNKEIRQILKIPANTHFYKEPSSSPGSKSSIILDFILPYSSAKISLIVP